MTTRLTHRRLRIGTRTALVGLLAGGAMLCSRGARAQQVDVNPPLPNTLILLDTSGSMEKMIDGNDPDADKQACVYKYNGNSIILNPAATSTPAAGTTPNRWGSAIESLTGHLAPVYNCVEMPRSKGSAFDTQYQINGMSPYDVDYFLPFRKPVAAGDVLANACVLGPNDLPGVLGGQGVGTPPKGTGGNAFDWPADGISSTLLTTPATSCVFTQSQDGVLDSARDMIRFGLMTYDQDTAGGTGVDSLGIKVQNTVKSPFDGSWSYFSGWNSSGTPVYGEPADCTSKQLFEVGSRNPSAPPWEGRFIMLPSDPNAPIAAVETQNDQIQLAISAMRAYGGTPTAGMFADAQYYFWQDPKGPQLTDPYVQGNCRDEYIIHITDGAPNLDLRPACAQKPVDSTKPGSCPYKLPEETALALSTGGSSQHIVKTFVIGFAVSSVKDGNTPVNCSSLVSNGSLAGVCSDQTKQDIYGPCCELQRIAIAGGTSNAYFADTAGDLNKALGAIIATIAQNTTTRTVPIYSPTVANQSTNLSAPTTSSSTFLASFSPIPGKPWVGDIQRERAVCTLSGGNFTVPPPVIDPTKGDDYATNLLAQGTTRQFRSMAGEAVSGNVASGSTMRKYISTLLPGVHGDDHLGTYGSAAVEVGTSVSALAAGLTPAHLNITARSCPNSLNTEFLTPASCEHLALNFLTAQPATDAMPDFTFAPFQSRALFPFGDIFHANPMVVAPPSALLQDESYQSFATAWAKRPTVIYAATNDGLLHAFNATVVDDGTTRDTSELWSFVPPAVLPNILATYPGNHELLLDGAPMVRDVVFDRSKAPTSLLLGSNWHTALVAGFGSQARGYYAVDVTDSAANSDLTKGPQFLWQLVDIPDISAGNPDRQLFGHHSGTPAITTVFVDLDKSGDSHEVAVAILPGGLEDGPVGGSCKRFSADVVAPAAFPSRPFVQCWSASGKPVTGRSLTVVRLDTGEVLRTFSRLADAPQHLIDAKRVGTAETPLDSPMTGIPVVYPATAGAVAQKVFIGDADGTLWRFNLTDKYPENWVGELYLDTYNTTNKSGSGFADGQPIQTAPVIAVDRLGQVVVEVATGDTETFTSTGYNYVYSTTEVPDTTLGKLRASVNWYLPFTNGERVSGPMSVFDGVFYFATYAANSGAAACGGGVAKLWGRDFVLPKDPTDLSLGGLTKLQSPLVVTSPAPDFILPGTIDPTIAGKVIPGVSVNFTPACADLSTSSTDQFVGGSHTVANSVTSGNYSLTAAVGAKNNQGGVKVFDPKGTGAGLTLPKPKTSTIVDSWAAVVE